MWNKVGQSGTPHGLEYPWLCLQSLPAIHQSIIKLRGSEDFDSTLGSLHFSAVGATHHPHVPSLTSASWLRILAFVLTYVNETENDACQGCYEPYHSGIAVCVRSVTPLSMWRRDCINGVFRYAWLQPCIAAMTSLNYIGCEFCVSSPVLVWLRVIAQKWCYRVSCMDTAIHLMIDLKILR
jgi:hypothetical protein